MKKVEQWFSEMRSTWLELEATGNQSDRHRRLAELLMQSHLLQRSIKDVFAREKQPRYGLDEALRFHASPIINRNNSDGANEQCMKCKGESSEIFVVDWVPWL